jgi:outer membrane protein OmpA-like peptidoglycan-associated protein
MKCGAALLGAAAVLALSTPANAARLTSWYGVFEGGGSAVQDIEIQQYTTPAPVPVTSTLALDVGWAALVSVGYAYDNGWRVELEGGYRHNGFDRVIGAGGVAVPASGDLGQYTLMANVLYDFPSASGVTLTVGAGVGADYARFDANSLVPAVQGDDVSLAFQAIAGLSYQLTSWLDLVLNYRYLYVTDFQFSDDAVLVPPAVAHVDTDNVHKHTVTMGFRFGHHKADAPSVVKSAPPPPPSPQAQVARQFVIYFGFNKCAITAEADAVLTEAAASSRTLGSVGVKIVGHTDTVGSRAVNQRLSECRAGAAKANLVNKGVPSAAITTAGMGETQLLVQTGDNVKEPQNRRATIDLD